MTNAIDPDGLADLRKNVEQMRSEIEATSRVREAAEWLESKARLVAYDPKLGAMPADGSTDGITIDLQSYSLGTADGFAFAIGYIRAALNGTPAPDAVTAFRSAGLRASG